MAECTPAFPLQSRSLMWWRGWEQQEDAFLSRLHSTAQHVHGDIWQSKAWTTAQLLSWLCPSLPSHGIRQARGRRRSELWIKRWTVPWLGWLGTRAGHDVGHCCPWGKSWAGCPQCHRVGLQKQWGCKDSTGPVTTGPGLCYCSPLPETCMLRHQHWAPEQDGALTVLRRR